MWVVNFDTPYFSLLLILVLAFILEHNVDEKNMQNIEVKTTIKIYLDLPPKKDSPQNLDPVKNFDSHGKF